MGDCAHGVQGFGLCKLLLQKESFRGGIKQEGADTLETCADVSQLRPAE